MPYVVDKAMPPTALSSGVNDDVSRSIRKRETNLLPRYAQKIARCFEETRQHFPDEFYLHGSMKVEI
jgi:hypothetical protein